MKSLHPARMPGGYSLPDQSFLLSLSQSDHEPSIIVKMQIISFLHLSVKLDIRCRSMDPISSRNGCISGVLGKILST